MVIERTVLARALPFAAYIFFVALNNPLTDLFNWLHVDIKWLYVFRIGIVSLCLLYFWREYTEIKKKPVISDFLYASVSGIIVLLIWIFPYPAWLGGNDTQAFNPLLAETKIQSILWISVRMMGAVIIVPIMEELFWRSFIMRWYDNEKFLAVKPENISNYSYVGSACLFALQHNLWFAGLFAGLVYGELYKTNKNLWVPIFAHAVTNGLLGVWIIWTHNWQYW
jgi:uncharacterized protein